MIGKRIAEVRDALSLSQEDFGKKINMAKSSISLLESGTRMPNERVLQLISHEFNVNEEWLRTGDGEMFRKSDLDFLELLGYKINELTDVEIQAFKTYLELPDDQRKLFISIMTKMFSK